MDFSSRDLVLAAGDGSTEAVDALVRAHLPGLHAYVRLHSGQGLRQREETVDIVQSACREVLVDMERQEWVGESEFRRWLFTAARSKIRDKIAFHQAARRAPEGQALAGAQPDLGFTWGAILAGYDPSPSQAAMGNEAIERLEQVFADLPEDQREAILMSRIAGLSTREIAEATGRQEDAVRKLISRGTARILRRLTRN